MTRTKPHAQRSKQLLVELLEDRITPAIWFVTDPGDTLGRPTLRWAIEQANLNPGPDEIRFFLSDPGINVIKPNSSLPAITSPITIDGTTQPGYAGTPKVQLNFVNGGFGFELTGGSSGSTLRGLSVTNAPSHGILIRAGSNNNVIEACHIGVDAAGTTTLPNAEGLWIESNGNRIGGTTVSARNVITGNLNRGMYIGGSQNLVYGNYIGTDRTGLTKIGTQKLGIDMLFASAVGNRVGDGTPAGRNILSGHLWYGISVGIDAAQNRFQGNYIGVGADGQTALANQISGINVGAVTNLVIGTDGDGVNDATEGNVISGNLNGVVLASQSKARIQGNIIGLNHAGTIAIPNTNDGIQLLGSSNILIGTDSDGISDDIEGNLISGNGQNGILITGPSARNNVVAGNRIGTDRNSQFAVGNRAGVFLTDGTSGNTIGTNDDGFADVIEGNLLSGNIEFGVKLFQGGDNLISGNIVGLSSVSASSLSGPIGKVNVTNATSPAVTVFNGLDDGARCFVDRTYEWIDVPPVLLNADYVQLANNDRTIPNLSVEIQLSMPSRVYIFLDDNISGQIGSLQWLSDLGFADTGLDIGLDVSPFDGLADEVHSVYSSVFATGTVTLGPQNLAFGNLLPSMYGIAAVAMTESPNGQSGLPNGVDGIFVQNSSDNRIRDNYIGSNGRDGIHVTGSAGGNIFTGNIIGQGSDGSAKGNYRHGIVMAFGASNNTIGGTNPSDTNIIRFNGAAGIAVAQTSAQNRFPRNSVSSNLGLGIDLGENGVTLNDTNDVDSGPNGLQNFPILMKSSFLNGLAMVEGTLNSAANSTYIIELFTTSTRDPSGYGEGETFRDSFVVATDASGNASFTRTISGLASGDIWISATATDFLGNTSEFSNAVRARGTEVRGQLFNDADQDGVIDANEDTLVGWTVYVDINSDGVRNPDEPFVLSNSIGQYSLDGFGTGTYRISVEPQSGWYQTSTPVGDVMFDPSLRRYSIFDGVSGAFIRQQLTTESGTPNGMVATPKGILWTQGPGGVTHRFDGNSGEYLGPVPSVLVTDASVAAIGGDGLVYIYGDGVLHQVNGDTGELLSTVVLPDRDKTSFAVDPSGYIYVSSAESLGIERYSPTGQFLGLLPSSGEFDQLSAGSMIAGPDGKLYVADVLGKRVLLFDVMSDTYLGVVWQAPANSSSINFHMALGSNGHVFMLEGPGTPPAYSNFPDRRIIELDGFGATIKTFATSLNSEIYTRTFTIIPSPTKSHHITLDGDDANGADFGFRINEAPTIEPVPDQFIEEGQLLEVHLVADDVNVGDTVIFSLGPSAPLGASIDAQSGLLSWTPLDDQSTPVDIEVIASDGGSPSLSTSAFVRVFVSNGAPTGMAANDGPVTEGGQATVSMVDVDDPSISDRAALRYAYDVDDDGSIDFGDLTYALAVSESSYTFSVTDNPSRVVRVFVLDDDGGLTSSTTTILVDNVAPVISLSGNATVDEGSEYVLTLGPITDPGEDTVTEWIVNWGDGQADSYMSPGAVTHVYTVGGIRTIRVDLVDEDGVHLGAGSFEVNVSRIDPAAVSAGGPYVIEEGNGLSLVASATPSPYSPGLYWVTWEGSNRWSVYRSALDGSEVAPIYTGTEANGLIRSIDIDPVQNKLYYYGRIGEAFGNYGFIRRGELDGTGMEDVLVSGVPTVQYGFEIDSINRRVYFGGTGFRRSNLDGSDLSVLPINPFYPSDMEIDPNGGKLYYTDSVSFEGIRRVNLDGSGGEAIYNGGVDFLALDISNSRIFFSDTPGKRIGVVGTDGSNPTTLLSGVAYYDIELDLDQGKIYFSTDTGIFRADLTGLNVEPLVSLDTHSDSISLDLRQPVPSYSWDINGDGVYGDAIGENPTLSWSQLVALGIDDGIANFDVRVRLNDGLGNLISAHVTTLTVTNVAPSVSFEGPSSVDIGAFETFGLSAVDPSMIDQESGFTYEIDWDGDGIFDETVVGLSGITVSHAFDTSGMKNVKVRATDKDGGVSDVATKLINVIEPVVVSPIDGPSSGVRYQPLTYTLNATGGSGSYTFEIDWDGNGSTDQVVYSVPSGTTITWAFERAGINYPDVRMPENRSYPARVRATDSQGVASSWSDPFDITIKPFELQPSTTVAGLTNLVVGGTPGTDVYFFGGIVGVPTRNINWFVLAENAGLGGDLNLNGIFGRIDDDGVFQGNFFVRSLPNFTGQLIVYAGNGFNYISAEPLIPKFSGPGAGLGVQLYGGSANDVLVGGTAGDLLVGGGGDDILRGGSGTNDGNDILDGGAGNDILIGHLGADVLRGGSGSDLLIAGQVFFVNAYQPGRIFDLQREWLSNRTYSQKVANLRGTGAGPRSNGDTFLQPGVTVLDDPSVDQVFGEGDIDWLIADTPEDSIDLRVALGEQLLEL